MEKYGRGWQRLPSWVGDDRQLIQPGGRPAKGGQMLGFFFTPWRTWPLGGEHPAGEGGCGVGDPRIWGVGWTVAGRWVEVGGGTAARSTAGQAFWRSLQIPNATTPASNKARLPGSGTAAILATRKPSL